MSSLSAVPRAAPAPDRPKVQYPASHGTLVGVFGLMAVGLAFTAYSIWNDVREAGPATHSPLAYLLLAVALVIALGFEFVNGFHDTANAVATVIYTHSLKPNHAVVWSGFFNFLGVLFSTGAVAFGVVSLLPVELILQVGSDAGFAMVFALLIAAIIWNLGTWWLGLPASSSHTLIGSIIGVGVANAMVHGRSGTSGIDWEQAASIGKALLISPLVGFFAAGALLLLMKLVIRSKQLYQEPKSEAPPPRWVRALLIFTCTGVSFAHGSNDGQKGMGLIMLILIGTVPTAYALNRAVPDSQVPHFEQVAQDASRIVDAKAAGRAATGDPRPAVTGFIRDSRIEDATYPALSVLIRDVSDQVKGYGTLSRIPPEQVRNTRNDMYLVSEALRKLPKAQNSGLSADDTKALAAYKGELDHSTKFIPTWVKIVVALALGLGTMIGWKRIVVTVGERIGKTHLTYGQGAAAELVAMATIAAADRFGLPVSTTHVLSSGVAGTMAANGSGVQMETIRNILLAWVLTLPCAILLSGSLYVVFSRLF
ncbi:inorganic phosphate transporter [Lichenihabitans sp. Uapishka_5]|uniref:inorganic phosphate transporter n=1 Tax=Lichenihabitans sp. Uapishka_5 TaxID=3037302 RepID=UPI0029E7D510|nr:inorganic phosphate transporter [Lichenihabitans sp. Uapishka_5]MDX7952723.1 inorganic phosphate transporter [Lichenihabitans sp. Uapishka_5]